MSLSTKPFEREDRYTVLKHRDIHEALDQNQVETLIYLEDVIDAWRKANGKKPLKCVVVEQEWPEYEKVWRMLESRMSGPTELIVVCCVVLPTGESLWFEAGENPEDYLQKVLSKWKAEHPEFEDTDATIGTVFIKMPKDKYIAIGARIGPGEFEFPTTE